jgi:hypothetical protein
MFLSLELLCFILVCLLRSEDLYSFSPFVLDPSLIPFFQNFNPLPLSLTHKSFLCMFAEVRTSLHRFQVLILYLDSCHYMAQFVSFKV